MSETSMTTKWGRWQTEGRGSDRWQHRYIMAISVDGVRYVSSGSDGSMLAPDGTRLAGVGRGEVRDYRRPATTYAAYSEDGAECDGEPHRLDAADECRSAIRAALTEDDE